MNETEWKKTADAARAFMVRLMCDKCGEGAMTPAGIQLLSNPPQYPHRCDKCGSETTIRGGKTYPQTEYEEVTPNVEFSGAECETANEIVKTRQERDQFAAQVEVMRDALLLYQNAGLAQSTDYALQRIAYDATVRALSPPPPVVLREIQARTLEEAALRYAEKCGESSLTGNQLRGIAKAKRKGEER